MDRLTFSTDKELNGHGLDSSAIHNKGKGHSVYHFKYHHHGDYSLGYSLYSNEDNILVTFVVVFFFIPILLEEPL